MRQITFFFWLLCKGESSLKLKIKNNRIKSDLAPVACIVKANKKKLNRKKKKKKK